MTASSRGGLALRGLLRASPSICTRCARSRQIMPIRSYSGAAAAAVETPIQPPAPSVPSSTTQPQLQAGKSHYQIRSGIILSRAPLLTRNLTAFEEAFFFYQKRLNERLTMPFISKSYFKKDTPALIDWELKLKDRDGNLARELGPYKGKSATAWDDELKVGDSLSKQETMLKALLKDAEQRVSDDAEIIPEPDRVPVEQPQPRETEADRTNNARRLDRKLDRTLYLVVKHKESGKWTFPTAPVATDENLHETAKRVMDQTAGVDMNTWMVSRVPVAHVVTRPVLKEDGSLEKRGDKTFFIKARIMAGQANLDNNPFGYDDFRWLTKEELAAEFAPEYYHGVRNMMADR